MEWISVNDRLPTVFEIVLVFCEHDNAYFHFSGTTYRAIYNVTRKKWVMEIDAIEKMRLTITHWMPLPEPPES
jgi:hypothetical protein